MKLTRVTITGADDAVDPSALLDLCAEFPFLEVALLCSKTRQGMSRYPTEAWFAKWAAAQQRRAPLWYPWAVHLCGEMSRRAMAGCPTISDMLGGLNNSPRVQLNGFSRYRLPMLALAERWQHTEFILQTGDLVSEFRAVELEKRHPNVTHLLDASGGRGEYLLDAKWAERHDPRVGYAGGIGPENVVATLTHLLAYKVEQNFWIDMESKVRTDDRFDLAKARRVLELAAPFVSMGVA